MDDLMPPADASLDSREPDEVLVLQLKDQIHGTYHAFDALVRRHKERIVADCRHMIGSAEEAEDLAQEVFVKAFCSLWSFRDQSKFRTWLQRIKINHCLEFLRRQKKRSGVMSRSEDFADARDGRATPEAQVITRESTSDVHKALAALPDTLRIPLVMCDMDGYAYQEIAAQLGIGLSATKMRIKRGREEFRRILDVLSKLDDLDD